MRSGLSLRTGIRANPAGTKWKRPLRHIARFLERNVDKPKNAAENVLQILCYRSISFFLNNLYFQLSGSNRYLLNQLRWKKFL